MNNYDHPEIQKALGVLFQERTVVEVRILNTEKGTVSGYFDDMDKLATEILPWSGNVPGISLTALGRTGAIT